MPIAASPKSACDRTLDSVDDVLGPSYVVSLVDTDRRLPDVRTMRAVSLELTDYASDLAADIRRRIRELGKPRAEPLCVFGRRNDSRFRAARAAENAEQ